MYVATHEQWRNLRSRAITANAGSFSVTFFLGEPLCIRTSPINRTRNCYFSILPYYRFVYSNTVVLIIPD